MDMPLQLKDYFFPYVEVASDPDVKSLKEDFSYSFETSISIQSEKESNLYQVSLGVSSFPENEKDNEQPYSIHLVAVGIFMVHLDWPDHDKLLRINGSSILYSAAREFLITITARGPYGQLMLPPVSFLKIYEEENQPKIKETHEDQLEINDDGREEE